MYPLSIFRIYGDTDIADDVKAYNTATDKKDKSKGVSASTTKECTNCKKYYPNSRYKGQVWHECNKLKNDKDKKQKDKDKDGKKDKVTVEVGKIATETKEGDDTEAVCCRSSSYPPPMYPPSTSWSFDTGASSHMSDNIDLLININHCHGIIKMGNAVKIPFFGKGTVEVSVLRQMLPRRIYCNLHRW
jgi:hypothetical protein